MAIARAAALLFYFVGCIGIRCEPPRAHALRARSSSSWCCSTRQVTTSLDLGLSEPIDGCQWTRDALDLCVARVHGASDISIDFVFV